MNSSGRSRRIRIVTVAVMAAFFGFLLQTTGLEIAYSQSLLVTAWATAEDPGLDPTAALWDAVPVAGARLTAQQITPPTGGSTPVIYVKAVHVGDDLVVRLDWFDETEDDSTATPETFSDAVAIEFPSDARSTVPAICMGQADAGVNIWQWRADSQAGVPTVPVTPGYVDFYPDTSELFYPSAAAGNPYAAGRPVQNLIAGGFGTLTAADQQTVTGAGVYADGWWSVVFRRSFASPGPDQPVFEVGQSIDVAMAAWNGSLQERDGMKAVSQFIRLVIGDEPIPPAAAESLPSSTGWVAYLVMAGVVGVLMVSLGATLWWMWLVTRSIRDGT